jgi:hypothetical protein
MKTIYLIFPLFVLAFFQNYCISQESDYDSMGWQLVETESLFILNNASNASEVITQIGEPEEKSKLELWGADGLEHQTWYYRSTGLEIDFFTDDTKTQIAGSIIISYPSVLKLTRGIGIGSTKDDVIKAYKKEINLKNEWGGQDMIVAGTEFGGVIFSFENNKVSTIFIGSAAE